MSKVIIIGPAYPLRGGLATFDQRLAKQFQDEGHSCEIYSFSLQYPSFLFPGTTQYSSDPPPGNLTIHSAINSINPLNWLSVGRKVRKLNPDIVVVRFWLPFMGPALGTILRQVKKNRHTRIIAITDNVIPHEKRFGDVAFTRYFLKACDGFITMSEKVMKDLRKFEPSKPAIQVLHPLYDTFGEPIPKEEARNQLGIDRSLNIPMFFGFIRKYKGLDILFDAMKILKERNVTQSRSIKLLVAGEFYEDSRSYHEQIERLGIAESIIVKTEFIPDSEVKYYFCASDVVVQPYRNATQSGVTPLSYHFEKPMIVTNVGSLPDLVPDGRAGIVCNPDPVSIADAIERFFELGKESFLPHLRVEKLKYSWSVLTSTIIEMGAVIQRK